MPFENVAPTNLASAAAAQVRELIANDVLRPGDALPGERELAAQMGISRTSLREALHVLTSEGLIVSKPGSGMRVSQGIGASLVDPLVALIDASPSSIFDYLAFRKMFEGEAAAFVAVNATHAEKNEIDRIADDMQRAYDNGEADRAAALDIEFHMSIVEATANVVTIQVARTLHQLLQSGVERHHKMIVGDATLGEKLMKQHHRINRAIQRGQCKAARDAMHEHLDFIAEIVKKTQEDIRRERIVAKRRSWVTAPV